MWIRRSLWFALYLIVVAASGCRDSAGEVYIGPVSEYCHDHGMETPDPYVWQKDQ